MLTFTTTESKIRKGRLRRGREKFEVEVIQIVTAKKPKLDNAAESEMQPTNTKPSLTLCTIDQVTQIATTRLSIMQIL